MDWNGRRLESISQNGTEVVSYDYNIDGQRVSKTYDGVTTEYFRKDRGRFCVFG